jgi:Protein of unknown function (DUF2848)
MSNKLLLELNNSSVEFEVRRLLVAGYTGRDSSQVRAHILELDRQGIPAPDRVPALYEIDPSWVTLDSDIDVDSPQVSGEAEPVILFPGGNLEGALVSVISDSTNREIERSSIARSKELPKPLSRRVWRYCDVAGCWDDISLRSWVEASPQPQYYQSGKLRELLHPRDLLIHFAPQLGNRLEGTVLLMGTVPILTKGFLFAPYFGCELETPSHSRIVCECNIRFSGGGRLEPGEGT